MHEKTEDVTSYLAMELTLRVGELMLAGGESAERVERAIIHLGQVYGLPRIEANVTLAAISVSYLPGLGRQPVTGERMVRRRSANFTRLVALQRLIGDAESGRLPLDGASERLRKIISAPAPYPSWLLHGALAMIGGAGAILVGGGAWAAAAAFAATLCGDRTGAWLGRRGVAEFFQVAVAAAIGALMAVLLVAADSPVSSGSVVVGVVIALIPGRALVASLQDGIAGDYMTGTVRLVETMFIIAAILAGVGFTIYLGNRLGVAISLNNLPYAQIKTSPAPLMAAGVISAAFAVYVMAPRTWLVSATLGGMAAWILFVNLLHLKLPAAAATLVATVGLGIVGTGYARARDVPPLVAVLPCLTPLMPGTLMYRALLEITTDHPGSGVLTLVEAVSTALALGAGVILGAEILRAVIPVRDRAVRVMLPVTRRVRR
ncbi:threonine/serine exporter family protein [Actinocorallia longicatena]|uniref:Threonine/serine exporter family protein n=1 Tax=Actinocorallia longicatena TaxID=111803 RepID=A0ABP6Q932_9ACTN